jgi:hypothetical protein
MSLKYLVFGLHEEIIRVEIMIKYKAFIICFLKLLVSHQVAHNGPAIKGVSVAERLKAGN